MSKLIAIPRRAASGPGAMALAAGAGFARPDRLVRTTETAADDSLLSLGLHAASPAPVEPVPKNSYKRLENLGAYIIDPPSRAASEKVKEELESDFIVVPNITLSVPEPVAGKARTRLGGKGQPWPEESGIARAHRNGVRGRGGCSSGCSTPGATWITGRSAASVSSSATSPSPAAPTCGRPAGSTSMGMGLTYAASSREKEWGSPPKPTSWWHPSSRARP